MLGRFKHRVTDEMRYDQCLKSGDSEEGLNRLIRLHSLLNSVPTQQDEKKKKKTAESCTVLTHAYTKKFSLNIRLLMYFRAQCKIAAKERWEIMHYIIMHALRSWDLRDKMCQKLSLSVPAFFELLMIKTGDVFETLVFSGLV